MGGESTVVAPRQILHEIGQEFNRLLKDASRPQAYRYLQKALMDSMDELVPSIIPLKDFFATVTELEEYLKGSLATTDKSPLEGLAEWLQGGSVLDQYFAQKED